MHIPRTVVSNLCLLLFFGLLIGFIPSCGGSSAPDKTVAAFMAAAEAGDYNRAASYCTAKFKDNEFSDPEEFTEMPSQDEEMPDWAVENLVTEMDGDYAGVWHKDMEWFVFEVKNEGGKWLIDGMDIDMSWMDDMFEEMMEGMGDFEMPEGMEDMPGGTEEEPDGK